jgi:hypothetical protein
MAVYRCLQSGNTVEFNLPHDIESMKGHTGYVRIDVTQMDEDVNEERTDTSFTMNTTKVKMGRPRKANV